MAKKKVSNDKDEHYTIEEVKKAEETMGDLMNQCSQDIYDVIDKYPLTPSMIYGILESIKLTIANELYSSIDSVTCPECKSNQTITKEGSSPKKVKEIDAAMYN